MCYSYHIQKKNLTISWRMCSPTEAESEDDHDDHYVESNDDPDWADLEDSAASGEESGEEDPLDAKPRNNVRYRK